MKVQSKITTTNKAEAKTPKPTAKSPVSKHKTVKAKSWNDMPHLFLKRFSDDDPKLTAGAKRDRKKHPHLVIAENDPTGRAKCKLCGHKIAKSNLRFTLFLECHKGYRNACTLHEECFWKHPERSKLGSMEEIHLEASLSQEARASIAKAFQNKSGKMES